MLFSNRRVFLGLSLLAALLLTTAGCAGRQGPSPIEAPSTRDAIVAPRAPFEAFAWPEDDHFRSAGRLRSLGPAHEGGAPAHFEKARLREHFARVLERLERDESSSLDLAADRLIAASGRAVRPAEREGIRRALARARARQLRVLAAYAERGLFPLNPEVGGEPRPIFVDAHDTACAVGHLMRMDGYADAVAEIQATTSFVYVEDVEEGPLLAWVAQSGLLVEEAALIQPSYGGPPAPGLDLEAAAAPGGSVEALGLRFENVTATRITYDPNPSDYPSLGLTERVLALGSAGDHPLAWAAGQARILESDPSILPSGSPITWSVDPIGGQVWDDFRLHVLDSYDVFEGGSMYPIFNTSPTLSPIVFWNAYDAGGFVDEPAALSEFSLFELTFDVSATASGYGIDAAAFLSEGEFWGPGNWGGDLFFEVLIEDMAGVPLVDFSEYAFDFFCCPAGAYLSRTDTFAPRDKLRVTIRGGSPYGVDAVQWMNFQQDFRIVAVPEPGTAALFALGLALLGARRRARG